MSLLLRTAPALLLLVALAGTSSAQRPPSALVWLDGEAADGWENEHRCDELTAIASPLPARHGLRAFVYIEEDEKGARLLVLRHGRLLSDERTPQRNHGWQCRNAIRRMLELIATSPAATAPVPPRPWQAELAAEHWLVGERLLRMRHRKSAAWYFERAQQLQPDGRRALQDVAPPLPGVVVAGGALPECTTTTVTTTTGTSLARAAVARGDQDASGWGWGSGSVQKPEPVPLPKHSSIRSHHHRCSRSVSETRCPRRQARLPLPEGEEQGEGDSNLQRPRPLAPSP